MIARVVASFFLTADSDPTRCMPFVLSVYRKCARAQYDDTWVEADRQEGAGGGAVLLGHARKHIVPNVKTPLVI